MLYMRSDSSYKTLEDIRKATEPPKCGAAGTGNSSYYFPKLVEEILGLRFNVVTGYPGATDIDLAVEKGELHCRASTIGVYFGREPGRTWAKTGFVRILVQGATKRYPRIPNTPTILELIGKEKPPETIRRLAGVLLATGKFGRPLVASPGIPPERVKILQDAWAMAVKEPELMAEVKKSGMDMDPVGGEELPALAEEVIDQPPEVIEKLKKSWDFNWKKRS
jgi:tripartite-type tricarboxylate transporter receptor subunit TctC